MTVFKKRKDGNVSKREKCCNAEIFASVAAGTVFIYIKDSRIKLTVPIDPLLDIFMETFNKAIEIMEEKDA